MLKMTFFSIVLIFTCLVSSCSYQRHRQLSYDEETKRDNEMCRYGNRVLFYDSRDDYFSVSPPKQDLQVIEIAKGERAAKVTRTIGCLSGIGILLVGLYDASDGKSRSSSDDSDLDEGIAALILTAACAGGVIAFSPLTYISSGIENALGPDDKVLEWDQIPMCSKSFLSTFLAEDTLYFSKDTYSNFNEVYSVLAYIKSVKMDGSILVELFADAQKEHPLENLFWALKRQSVNEVEVRVYDFTNSPYPRDLKGDYFAIKHLSEKRDKKPKQEDKNINQIQQDETTDEIIRYFHQ